jgi:hypothetical protein
MADLPGLVTRDHDELESALLALGDPVTERFDSASLIETAQLVLSIHVTAETGVMLTAARRARSTSHATSILRLLETARDDHGEQCAMLDRVARTCPGTPEWSEAVLELQVLALDHRWRAPRALDELREALDAEAFESLAGEYATTRLMAFSVVPRSRRQPSSYELALA